MHPSFSPANAASSAESLRRLGRLELKILFRSLSAPPLQELSGEYDAQLLDQGGYLAGLIVHTFFHAGGKWTGKAFAPTSSGQGVGYNTFQRRGRTIQQFPMRTYRALGQGGGPSVFLEYASLNRGIVSSMVGEVRRVDAGLYLGFGVVGPSPQRRIPFLLAGPQRAFAPVPAIAASVYPIRPRPRLSFSSLA